MSVVVLQSGDGTSNKALVATDGSLKVTLTGTPGGTGSFAKTVDLIMGTVMDPSTSMVDNGQTENFPFIKSCLFGSPDAPAENMAIPPEGAPALTEWFLRHPGGVQSGITGYIFNPAAYPFYRIQSGGVIDMMTVIDPAKDYSNGILASLYVLTQLTSVSSPNYISVCLEESNFDAAGDGTGNLTQVFCWPAVETSNGVANVASAWTAAGYGVVGPIPTGTGTYVQKHVVLPNVLVRSRYVRIVFALQLQNSDKFEGGHGGDVGFYLAVIN